MARRTNSSAARGGMAQNSAAQFNSEQELSLPRLLHHIMCTTMQTCNAQQLSAAAGSTMITMIAAGTACNSTPLSHCVRM